MFHCFVKYVLPTRGSGLVLFLFIVVITPQIVANKRTFGRYFYNVNTTFYIWYDSWEDVKLGTRAHGDREGWPKMAPDQIPSAGKYWREHTAEEIYWRWIVGILKYFILAVTSYGWFRYVLLLGALAGGWNCYEPLGQLEKSKGTLLLTTVCYMLLCCLYGGPHLVCRHKYRRTVDIGAFSSVCILVRDHNQCHV